jgi:hypothetical protein
MDATSLHASSEADDVRSAEQKRLSALTTGNMEVARQLHADDFQLVTPLGAVFSGGASEPSPPASFTTLPWNSTHRSMFGYTHDVALVDTGLTSRSRCKGREYPRAPYWFTDATRSATANGRSMWSQGTGIARQRFNVQLKH